ncbi:PAS domain S-box-containing protein/diguanylate cyclase (GGDEF)-like protein [Crenobacter luteus]|uniref:diguanylate cyclase domain-containing protein n=1 Tax=Crenobacter luteus TaxID=1452487 RepID=UPI0010DDA009|nr:diguanylate cyclase [Crenobacter luteus]TCP15244.1 PAS domain S-box-containing protein/diguanylate cyclase (GGDEF)-like protein [Crenobacter luteus]
MTVSFLPASQGGVWRRLPAVVFTLLLGLGYVVSGKLSLLLAIAPGYASAIFPPAGVAIAAAFVAGRRAWPGVFLGSLLLNLWVGAGSGATAAAAALLIALSSTLQAAWGGAALRRTLGYPVRFDCARELLLFHLLAPLLCLVSASLSVAALVALDIVPAGHFAAHWLRWWIGDTLGLLVVLPLALVCCGAPRGLWRRRATTVALPMLVAFAALTALYVQVSRWEEADALTAFHLQSRRLADTFQRRLDEQAALLEQAEGLFAGGGPVDAERFARFAEKPLRRYPTILAIEWAPRVTAADRAAFEAQHRLRLPDFEIREGRSVSRFRRASPRAAYYPVTFIAPMVAPNRAALGFDLASLPDRREAIEAARRSGTVVASTPLRLVLAQKSGLLLMQTVRRPDGTEGMVLTVLRAADFVEKLLPDAAAILHIRLVDAGTGQSLYDSFGSPAARPLLATEVVFGGRRYRLETAPRPSYVAARQGWQSWIVLAAGTLGCGLLGALLMLATGHTARVAAQVRERTAALRDSEARVLEIASTLAEGVYVLDDDGRVVFVNPEACRLLGRPEYEILGRKAHALFHHMHADRSPLLPEASPLLKVLRSGGRWRGQATFWRQDGEALPVEVSAAAILREGRSAGAVIAFSDISERLRLEATLRREASHDALTELPNRRLFMRRLQRALDRAERSGRAGAVLFLDLDGFKQINDAYGHEVGDEVLRLFGQRLQAAVRKTDTVARLAGDEFTVLLEGLAEPFDDAEEIAHKIVASVAAPAIVATRAITLATSVGIAVFRPGQRLTPDAVLSGADAAMYRAKMTGRNGIACKA